MIALGDLDRALAEQRRPLYAAPDMLGAIGLACLGARGTPEFKIVARSGGRDATTAARRPTSSVAAVDPIGGFDRIAAALRWPLFGPLRIASIADRVGVRDWAAVSRPGALGADRLLRKLDAAFAAIPPAIEYEVVTDD